MSRRTHRRRLIELGNNGRDASGPRYILGEDDEGPILSLTAFVLVCVVIFGLLLSAAVVFGSRRVERTVEEAAYRWLLSNNYDQVEVEVDGRSVTLLGVAPDTDAVGTIPKALEALPAIRHVDPGTLAAHTSDLEQGPVESEQLVISWDGDGATITGTVSTVAIRERIVSAAADVFATVDAEGLVLLEGVAPEEPWLDSVLDVMTESAPVTAAAELVVNANSGVATLSSELDDRQVRTDLRVAAENALAAGPLAFISGLTVTGPGLPPPPPPEVVEALQHDLDELIEGKVVEFELNSDALTEVGRDLLDEVFEALQLVPDVPVEIAGHADTTGNAESNQELSERRARAVLDYLVDRGVDPERFTVVGYGDTRPIASNDTEEGRAKNRRIEFIALED